MKKCELFDVIFRITLQITQAPFYKNARHLVSITVDYEKVSDISHNIELVC